MGWGLAASSGPADSYGPSWCVYGYFTLSPLNFPHSSVPGCPGSLGHQWALSSGNSVSCPGRASLMQTLGQQLGAVGFSPPPPSFSQSSVCLLLCPTWTSPPLHSSSTETGSAPIGPASSVTPCGTGQLCGSGLSPISGGGSPGGCWVVLRGIRVWAESPFLQSHSGLHRGERGRDPRWLRGCRTREPLCDACRAPPAPELRAGCARGPGPAPGSPVRAEAVLQPAHRAAPAAA